MVRNWNELDFIDFIFGISIAVSLVVFFMYALTLLYYIYKTTRLRNDFYSSSARLARDLELKQKRFTEKQKELEQIIIKLKWVLDENRHILKFTCDELKEIKNELKTIRTNIQTQNKGAAKKNK